MKGSQALPNFKKKNIKMRKPPKSTRSKKRSGSTYPVIDLFAGPGGLGEGFASLESGTKKNAFKILVSIERDKYAHDTLLLRHFFRSFQPGAVPEDYYRYLAGDLLKVELIKNYSENWRQASEAALKISLGPDSHKEVKTIIKDRLSGIKKWVLVGGPPCQAYSLIGRSRMMGNGDFEEDERHFLYREYLKIIIDHAPPVFVMENVKGLLSAKVKGKTIIHKIFTDLAKPKKAVGKKDDGLSYRLYSLSEGGEFKEEANPASFIVKAEEYGIPQSRHRMFIVGIRSNLSVIPSALQKKNSAPTVKNIIGNMPRIRSGLSKGQDSADRWQHTIRMAGKSAWLRNISSSNNKLASVIKKFLKPSASLPSHRVSRKCSAHSTMQSWYGDDNLKVLTAHETRSHIEKDLHRYLFAAAYSQVQKVSPKLSDFPVELLPNHKNVEEGRKGKMFSDRFRVQLSGRVATTITSHISKDGHYFIHYDPLQCRSLTVREAARLQTFPDNYHFEGPRTYQYHQVGNAVPPYLAMQIAEIIKDVLDRIPE